MHMTVLTHRQEEWNIKLVETSRIGKRGKLVQGKTFNLPVNLPFILFSLPFSFSLI